MKVDIIKENIEESTKNINLILENAQKSLKKHEKTSLESNQYKKQIEVLKALLSLDSETWKSFVKSASKYSKEIEDSDENCIYCRQPLDSDALDIVNAYSKYLNNESEVKLENINNEINLLIKSIEKINLSFEIKPEIKQIFEQKILMII